jgi:hypothetical protein
MDMLNEWYRTVVHTEEFKESQITVTHYTNGTGKGSYSYDLHSDCFPHADPISAGRGTSIDDCVTQAKKSHKSFWGPRGARKL